MKDSTNLLVLEVAIDFNLHLHVELIARLSHVVLGFFLKGSEHLSCPTPPICSGVVSSYLPFSFSSPDVAAVSCSHSL